MATINDVAKLAGVSKGTVSHVFNGTKYTSEAVKRRVYKAAKTLNYKSNYFARTLATNRSKVIGIQLESTTGVMPLFQQKVVNGILKACNEANYYLLLMPKGANDEEYFPIDGLIFMNPKLGDKADLNFPHIWLGRPAQDGIRTASYYVDNDNYQLLYELTQYLLARTQKGILYLNTAEELTVSKDRKQGYCQAIHKNSQALFSKSASSATDIAPTDPAPSTYPQESPASYHYYYDPALNPATFAYDTLQKQFDIGAIDTLIIDNDYMAQGAYRFAQDHQLNIPEDLSIIAISEALASSEFFQPTLSYVDLKEFELGYRMATNLIKLIHREKVEAATIIQSQVKFTESVRNIEEGHDGLFRI